MTVVFVNSKSLCSIKMDDTPVDDPSLKVLAANNSATLRLLKMSSCPHVSPAGQTTYPCRSLIVNFRQPLSVRESHPVMGSDGRAVRELGY